MLSTKKFYRDLKLGILGGGQLGRMLIQQAINYSVSIHVLDPDEYAPAKSLCGNFVLGSLSDYETVYHFGKGLDMLTIEIEKVNVDALEQLEQEGIVVYPQPRTLRLIQDKALQKQFLKENNLPTADFQVVDSLDQLRNNAIGFPCVQKLRKDGYDGKGVYRIESQNDLARAFTQASIIEKWIDCEKEMAVIVARNEHEEIRSFPLVEMVFNQDTNLLTYLISPAVLPEKMQHEAKGIAERIVDSLKLVGLLAVEMFLDKGGNIFVNELAPRPHNSGHHTIEGNKVSQFDQHLRAIFNQALGDTDCTHHAVMYNLLGENNFEGPAVYYGLEEALKESGVYVHLYGKKYTKPFRKMGHLTVIDADRSKAIEKAKRMQKILKVQT